MLAWEAQQQADTPETVVELAAMNSLHDLSMRLITAASFDEALDTVLDGAIDLNGADFGDLQLYHSGDRTLRIARSRKFSSDFLDTFKIVKRDDPCACGRALQTKSAIVIQDVECDPEFAPYAAAARHAGFRAVQSIPLISGTGQCVGVLSTHFKRTHRPSQFHMRVLTLLARQAAELLLRFKREDARRVVDQIAAKEMSHRLKNVLTMVQSIARQSRKTTSSTSEHASAFDERLAALGRAHTVLAEADWKSASVRTVISEQVLPLASGQFSLEGPDAIVGPDAGYVLALVLHELAVNARKHGALRDKEGRVEINWTVASSSELLLRWTERADRPVSPPTRQGFGTALVDNLVRARLIQRDVEYAPSGLVWHLRLPLRVEQIP